MKKLLLGVAVLAALSNPVSGQDTSSATPVPQLLSLYYSVKDALVAGNAAAAAEKAAGFADAVKAVDAKTIGQQEADALIKSANRIHATSNLGRQRDNFADLSVQMINLVKHSAPGSTPVYQAYCPMKKSSWLTSSKQIKNPYFGSAMLTCGEVVDTLH